MVFKSHFKSKGTYFFILDLLSITACSILINSFPIPKIFKFRPIYIICYQKDLSFHLKNQLLIPLQQQESEKIKILESKPHFLIYNVQTVSSTLDPLLSFQNIMSQLVKIKIKTKSKNKII